MNGCKDCEISAVIVANLRKQLGMSPDDELLDLLRAWNLGAAHCDTIRELQSKVKKLENALITTHEVGRRVMLALGLELPVSDDPPAGVESPNMGENVQH